MFGTISEEMEVKVAASEAWKVYGTLLLAEVVVEQLPQMILKVDLLEGDGGAGTVLHVTFPPGSGPSYHKEKFMVVDQEKRVKEVEVVEAGFLDKGLDLYRIRFEIIEKHKQGEEGKEEDSCIIKCTVEYQTKDLAAANVAVASMQGFEAIMKATADYLTKNKNN